MIFEIARPSKGEITSCIEKLDLEPQLVDLSHVCSQHDHGAKKWPRPECQHPVDFVNIINGHFSM